MSMKIISPRHTELSYGLVFTRKGETGGFSFPCDAKGTIFFDQMGEIAHQSYKDCQDRTMFDPPEIRTYETRVGAVGQCTCGRELSLDNSLDNECQCGRCYNMSGQEVTPSWECNEIGEPLAWQNGG